MIVIADIKIKEGIESEFKAWFEESNKELSKVSGFVSRRLLKAPDGTHRIIVEHQSMQTFEAMRQSPEHVQLHARAVEFMKIPPSPKIYDIIAE